MEEKNETKKERQTDRKKDIVFKTFVNWNFKKTLFSTHYSNIKSTLRNKLYHISEILHIQWFLTTTDLKWNVRI